MSTIKCSNCQITLTIPPGAKSIRCSECEAITQVGFAAFGLTPSTSFNYLAPQSGFSQQVPPSQNFASFGLTPSKSFNYVPPQSGFGLMQHSGSFNYTQQQQQQQPVFPSSTGSNSISYGVPGRKKAVIIGVSYKNTRHELKGCINDAKFMKHLLITKFCFTEEQIVMLTGN